MHLRIVGKIHAKPAVPSVFSLMSDGHCLIRIHHDTVQIGIGVSGKSSPGIKALLLPGAQLPG